MKSIPGNDRRAGWRYPARVVEGARRQRGLFDADTLEGPTDTGPTADALPGNLFLALAQSLDSFVWVTSGDGQRLLHVGTGLERLIGRSWAADAEGVERALERGLTRLGARRRRAVDAMARFWLASIAPQEVGAARRAFDRDLLEGRLDLTVTVPVGGEANRRIHLKSLREGEAVIGIARDVTAEEARERRLRRLEEQAQQDPLTGLLNRRGFQRAFTRLARRVSHDGSENDGGSQLYAAVIDLDDFKSVNDEHGHAAGDEVLRTVAGALEGATRPGDLLARVGGDEFLAVLKVPGRDQALAVAERLRLAVREATFGSDRGTEARVPSSLRASVSIGLVELQGSDRIEDVTELLERTRPKLSASKRCGKDRVVA